MIVLIKVFDQIIKEKKSEVRLRRYCNFKKLSIVSLLTWINFWRFYFLKNNFQKSIFSKNFKKDAEKYQNEIFEKNFQTIFFNNPRPTAVPISHSCVHTNSNVVYTLSTDAFYRCPVLVIISICKSASAKSSSFLEYVTPLQLTSVR